MGGLLRNGPSLLRFIGGSAVMARIPEDEEEPGEWVGKTAHYVRAGASGANDGTDWTNAFTTLPGTLTRDHVYYIADGNYGAYTFNDAVSGTLKIYIVKATASDHGTETGWNSAFGDGQAIWDTGDGLDFTTNYWVFDGQIGAGSTDGVDGSGSDKTTYGFLVEPDWQGAGNDTIGIAMTASFLTVRHTAVDMPGEAFLTAGEGQMPFNNTSGSNSDVTVSYCYVNNGNVLLRLWGDRTTVEYTYCGVNWSADPPHGATFMFNTSPIFRWNIVTSGVGICGEPGGGVSDDLTDGEFYGNLIFGINTTNGFLKGTSSAGIQDSLLYNNTFANSNGPLIYQNNPGTGAGFGNVLRNNLIYNVDGLIEEEDGGPIDHDYNWSSSSGSDVAGETNGQSTSGDPFVNAAGGDYTLLANTNAGETLGAPYDTDMFGNTRTTWTRGAFEF